MPRESTVHDQSRLTGCYNHRVIFDLACNLLRSAMKQNNSVTIHLISICPGNDC
ncbi:hypothetical protein BJ928_13610 [Rhizobium sp. WW_1]|jgi:hypothetical protein|nr:hypothetical protein BJ928_13610 [Rhizobium sp. WW_1]